jgi:hypothetical protein
MKNIDEIRKRDNANCYNGITIFECLYICAGCDKIFQRIKAEQEKKPVSERKKKIEILTREISGQGKWSGGGK